MEQNYVTVTLCLHVAFAAIRYDNYTMTTLLSSVIGLIALLNL